ncbi:MAG: methyltransferase [Oceanobacter sp.]
MYDGRFDEVLAFHKVDGCWIAPVQQDYEAFHIDTAGRPIYQHRFQRCFGYYNNLAAVIDKSGWYHIDQAGNTLYPERYKFAGNYQEGIAVVMDSDGQYFHLDSTGESVYDARWQYCGDYRDGIAVVQSDNGLSTHIRADGALLHDRWFFDLDVFHKGYARAKTHKGWCHVDKQGDAIYPERYVSVEPFYNGFARCETHDGALLIIDESGLVSRQLRAPTVDRFSELSADMVGYWKTYTIYTGVKLGIFDQLPGTLETLSEWCSCNLKRLSRLMRGLDELGLVRLEGDHYIATPKGSFLCLSHEKTLADAAIEYGEDLLKRWGHLPELIQGAQRESDIFSAVASDPDRVTSHHRMLASYARHDYSAIVPLLPIREEAVVLDAAGGTGTLTTLLQKHFPSTSVYLGDLKSVVAESQYSNKLKLDLFSQWSGSYDVVILARVLHDWADGDVVKILHNARQSLRPGGEIFLLDMLLDQNSSSGALCDLHLLAATGGQERTLKEFESLARQAELKVKQSNELPSLVSLIILELGEHNG